MSTAVVAAPPTTAATAGPTTLPERHVSPRQYTAIAPSASTSSNSRSSSGGGGGGGGSSSSGGSAGGEPAHKRPRASPPSLERLAATAEARSQSTSKKSPNSARMIQVKKEPSSPSMPASKRRPNRLDLSASGNETSGPHTARPSAGPLTSQQSAGLSAIQDVGLACLSPGFQTHDPAMREQLQRSVDVRNQQRQIIEARQKGKNGGGSPSSSGDNSRLQEGNSLFGVPTKTPSMSRRKGPPPGLAISAPSASQFAHERVVQSAPLNQTFTGLNSRMGHGPSGLGNTSHIHHAPAHQTNNRLPPIADVFAQDRLEAAAAAAPPSSRGFNSPGSHAIGNGHQPPLIPSPGFPPPGHQQMPPLSARSRDFRSAEEAVQGLSGGRDDLLPKVVHYGGVQPPTPPSPMPLGSSHVTHPSQHQQHSNYRHQHELPDSHRPQIVEKQPPEHPHTAPPPLQHPYHQHQHSKSSIDVPAHAIHPSHHSAGGPARPDMYNRTASMNGRRRGRDEFERDNGSPPPPPLPPYSSTFSSSQHSLHHPHSSEAKRAAPFATGSSAAYPPLGSSGGGARSGEDYDGDEMMDDRERERERFRDMARERDREREREMDWRAGLTGAEKREEFLRLCERAWDLFHS